MTETLDTVKFTPEKSKQIAQARLDLIHKWLEEKGVQVSYSFEACIKKTCNNPNRTAYGFHWEFVG